MCKEVPAISLPADTCIVIKHTI
ncbi:hypothetical protein CBM2626_A130202 [Cupriavidus taiwanensis]|nr:hypothetical protein CBM2626_A130202 [Cupriavidus taiwanensis]